MLKSEPFSLQGTVQQFPVRGAVVALLRRLRPFQDADTRLPHTARDFRLRLVYVYYVVATSAEVALLLGFWNVSIYNRQINCFGNNLTRSAIEEKR